MQKFLLIIILLFSLNTMASLEGFTENELLSAEDVIHPDLNYSQKDEGGSYDAGLVKLIFMVDKTGKPFEIVVVDSSMPKFIPAAIQEINKYQYKAATLNQEPIESFASATIVYELSRRLIAFDRWYLRNEGLKEDKEFSYIAKKLDDEVKSKRPDKDKLYNMLAELSGLKSRSFARLAWLSSERLKVAELYNENDARIKAIQNLIIYDGLANETKKILDEESLSSAEIGLLKLKIESGRYADALDQYDSSYTDNKKIKIIFAEPINQIKELKNNDSLVARDLKISKSGYINVPLFKRLFLFDQIQGKLQSIKLRCETHFAKFEYNIDDEYQIPDSWGQCQLQIIGDKGTSFRLLQQ